MSHTTRTPSPEALPRTGDTNTGPLVLSVSFEPEVCGCGVPDDSVTIRGTVTCQCRRGPSTSMSQSSSL